MVPAEGCHEMTPILIVKVGSNAKIGTQPFAIAGLRRYNENRRLSPGEPATAGAPGATDDSRYPSPNTSSYKTTSFKTTIDKTTSISLASVLSCQNRRRGCRSVAKELTKRQRDVLDGAIKLHRKGQDITCKSLVGLDQFAGMWESGIRQHLLALERKGFLTERRLGHEYRFEVNKEKARSIGAMAPDPPHYIAKRYWDKMTPAERQEFAEMVGIDWHPHFAVDSDTGREALLAHLDGQGNPDVT